MVQCLVTGAAGFIGSHLCEQLLLEGHQVIGLDAFIPYYPRSIKESYLAPARDSANFTFYELDLRYDALQPVLAGVEVVFHLAAMPGLVRSWSDFDLYMSCNLQGTQRLLEVTCKSDVKHFIYGSTSSVYGQLARGNEARPLVPISPYGVTKLSAEHLCQAYARTYALPLTVLRFFSVYGPRQRPDMAYHKFIQALLQDQPITVYGDGEQSRSNTYITDCIRGVLLAFGKRDVSVGETFNLGGGEVVTVNQALAVLASLTKQSPRVSFVQAQPGDQKHTVADFSKARRLLGYVPTTSVTAGLYAQFVWQQRILFKESPVLHNHVD